MLIAIVLILTLLWFLGCTPAAGISLPNIVLFTINNHAVTLWEILILFSYRLGYRYFTPSIPVGCVIAARFMGTICPWYSCFSRSFSYARTCHFRRTHYIYFYDNIEPEQAKKLQVKLPKVLFRLLM
jgi:hypothetical protein